MMAVVPSSHDNAKTKKDAGLNVLNTNTVSTLSTDPLNTRTTHDESTYGQLYQFQQPRNRRPKTPNRQRHSSGHAIVLLETSYDDQQSAHENTGIQLPLIETHQPRLTSGHAVSRKPSEPLSMLPLKRRRNPLNYPIPQTSDDAKRELLRLAGRDGTGPTARSTFESLSPGTNECLPRMRTSSREDYEGTNTSIVQPIRPVRSRNSRATLEPLTSSQHFLGYNGKERAATVIQSHWRGWCARRAYQGLKKRKWAVSVIARAWLMYSKLFRIRNQLKLTRQRQLDFFQMKQSELRDNWSQIASNRRVIVHVPSLGLTQYTRRKLQDLPLRENYQIGRLCELEDPNVDVIYVAPMTVNGDILQYYNRLISLRAMVEQGSEKPTLSASTNANDRFKIIVPEALDHFRRHNMCLSTLLKYSPKALKQIKSLLKNRPAYLVTGISHIDDLYIAEYLDIPIYGCEPEASYLYSTKSGSKRILKSSDVPMPFGEYDIYEQSHLWRALAQLITEHPDVQRWILKIDDQFDGLGIAYCDTAVYLPCYQSMVKEAEKFGEDWPSKSSKNDFYTKLLSELPDVLAKHTVYVDKARFDSWQSYLKVFLYQGGIIEAYPPSESITSLTVCLAIELDGRYSLICSGDQLHAESSFSCWGLAFPQSSVEPIILNEHCASIAEQCKHRHIYGYVDVDFVTFIDARSEKQHIWATDLSVGYSEHLSLFRVMKYITTGQFNSQMHAFTVKMKQPKQRLRNWQNGAPEYTVSERNRFAVWSSRLYHTGLSAIHYSAFFQLCRTHSVGFDIREKLGSIFTLLESDHHEHIGMITISETLPQTLGNFVTYLNAIHREITTTDSAVRNNFMLAVNDIENILDTTQDNVSNTLSKMTTS